MSTKPNINTSNPGRINTWNYNLQNQSLQTHRQENQLLQTQQQKNQSLQTQRQKNQSLEIQRSYPQQSYPSQSYSQQPYPSQSYPQQPYPSQSYPQQYSSQQSYLQQPYPQQSYPQQSYPQQSYPQQHYPQQSYPQQSYPQRSYLQESYLQQSSPQQSSPQQSYLQQSYPRQSYPQQNYPQQSYPQQPHQKRINKPKEKIINEYVIDKIDDINKFDIFKYNDLNWISLINEYILKKNQLNGWKLFNDKGEEINQYTATYNSEKTSEDKYLTSAELNIDINNINEKYKSISDISDNIKSSELNAAKKLYYKLLINHGESEINWKNILNEYLQKNNEKLPSYDSWNENGIWKTKIIIKFKGKEKTYIAESKNKVDVEQIASKKMYNMLIYNEDIEIQNKNSLFRDIKRNIHNKFLYDKPGIYLIDIENIPKTDKPSNNQIMIGFVTRIYSGISKFENWISLNRFDKNIEWGNSYLINLDNYGLDDMADHYISAYVFPLTQILHSNNLNINIYIVSKDKAAYCTKQCLEHLFILF